MLVLILIVVAKLDSNIVLVTFMIVVIFYSHHSLYTIITIIAVIIILANTSIETLMYIIMFVAVVTFLKYYCEDELEQIALYELYYMNAFNIKYGIIVIC